MYIADFLNTVSAAQVQLLYEDTFQFLVDPDKESLLQRMGKKPDPGVLSQYKLMDDFVTLEFSDDPDVLAYLVKQNLAIASVISTDGEVVSTGAGSLIKFDGDFFKLAIAHNWDEKKQEQMLKFKRMMPGNMSQTFVDMLFGSVASLQPRVVKLANVLTWQVLQSGQVSYTDPRSGVTARLAYSTTADQYPTALTGTARWDQYATATGLQDIEDHLLNFYDKKGYYPDKIVMSNRLAIHLSRQESTRNRALSTGMLSNVPAAGVASAVSPEILMKLVPQLAMSKTQLEIYDAQYEIETSPGQTVKGRYLNDNSYCFLTSGMGKRLFGPTIENEGRSGLFVKTEQLQTSPPRDRSYCVGKMVPFFPQPDLLGGRTVA